MNRNANTYRDTWINLADDKGIMIFSFEFPNAYYPNSISYQEGNIFNQNGVLNSEDKWSFSIIEPVFDYIKHLLIIIIIFMIYLVILLVLNLFIDLFCLSLIQELEKLFLQIQVGILYLILPFCFHMV